jgi:alpha/beta superfamily hydrolase
MNAQTERLHMEGAAGRIEVLRDQPVQGLGQKGIAIIAHPHPLFGGTMDNKVVQTLARAFVQCGWQTIRFNFRGVGASEGVHDQGLGETQDFLAVVQEFASGGALALAGFSFGSFVMSQAVEALAATRQIEKLVFVGTAAARFRVKALPQELHVRTLVLHGEVDDTVPLAAVMDWARPQSLPVTVIPGGEHFFHGQLPLLKSLVVRHLSSTAS